MCRASFYLAHPGATRAGDALFTPYLLECIPITADTFAAIPHAYPLPSLCRASFYLAHPGATRAGDALFTPYLLECTERDGAAVVGLGLGTWLFIICFVLLSSECP